MSLLKLIGGEGKQVLLLLADKDKLSHIEAAGMVPSGVQM
jgi:hypothetical protein